MKIKVSQLEPNPFRNMPEYPIDEAKVQTLMKSIKSTTFWDNILARPSPKGKKAYYWVWDENDEIVGYFDINGQCIETISGGIPVTWEWQGKVQIAYGHHRWIALKRLKIKEIDIPVRKLSDENMLRIMAEENLQEFNVLPRVVNETVKQANKFLVDHPQVARRYSQKPLAGKRFFGERCIAAFLNGNWSADRVGNAIRQLEAIQSGEVSQKAIDSLPSTKAATHFTEQVKRITKVTGEKPRAATQQKVAKKFESGKIKKAEVYGELITEQYPGSGRRTVPKVDFGNYISETALAISNLTRKLTNIRQVMKRYPKEQMPEEMNELLGSVNILAMELREFAGELKKRKTKQKLLT